MSDDSDDKPGIVKKGAAAVAGVAAALYLLPIPLPFINWLDNVLAALVVAWSLRTLGLRPVKAVRDLRERKRLKAASKELPEKG